MLEFARKQERTKYDDLNFSIDLNHREKKPELSEQVSDGPVQSVTPEKSLLVRREGQQVLRQELEEVGYTTPWWTRSPGMCSPYWAICWRSAGPESPGKRSAGPPRSLGGISSSELLLVKQVKRPRKMWQAKMAKSSWGDFIPSALDLDVKLVSVSPLE